MSADTHGEGSLAAFLAIAQTAENRFEGVGRQANRSGTIFGGEVFAQALKSAASTVPDRLAHSAQASFFRPGSIGLPLIYNVERVRDGANYAARSVTARQGDKVLLTLSASFKDEETDILPHRPQDGLDWPRPETLSDLRDLQRDDHPRRYPDFPGLEIRPCDPAHFLLREAGPRVFRNWFRARGLDGGDARENQAALAFLSDFGVPLTAVSPHVADARNTRMFVPTLNHSIWFTQRAEPSDWIAYRTEGRWTGDGRTLTFGQLYDADGRLVASTAQENVMRRPADPAG